MTAWDTERRRKLNDEFENVFREHDRLQRDLNADDNQHCKPLLDKIDKWEQDAIKKIRKTAEKARHDLQQLRKNSNTRLQRALFDTVTQDLQAAIQDKNNFSEMEIDHWMVNLSEIRKHLETITSTIDFTSKKSIPLIKLKQEFIVEPFQKLNLNHQQFNFKKLTGHPTFYKSENLISSNHPTRIVSQNSYASGTHYFRFRVRQAVDDLFFGIMHASLPYRTDTIHGWWNIDRRVIGGKKQPYVSTLNIRNADEVILIMNCDAHEIFLEYPSMWKLNSMKIVHGMSECPVPWKLVVETGSSGDCSLKLVKWGILTHAMKHSNNPSHCFCTGD